MTKILNALIVEDDYNDLKHAKRIVEINFPDVKVYDAGNRKEALNELANGYRTDYLFTTNTGELYDRHNIEHSLDKYYDKLGITHRGLHTYRRTFCTNLCRAGVPIQVASRLMGHAGITDTARYYVNVPSKEKMDAVKALEKWTDEVSSS